MWRLKVSPRFGHGFEGCEVAKRVLSGLRHSDEFIDKVSTCFTERDLRLEARRVEDALMRDTDRASVMSSE
jgi:hypothetical protein